MTITAYDTESTELGNCTTDENGACTINISPNGTRIFVQDATGIPEGYRPVSSIQRVFTYTEFAEVAFEIIATMSFRSRITERARSRSRAVFVLTNMRATTSRTTAQRCRSTISGSLRMMRTAQPARMATPRSAMFPLAT